MSDESKSRDRVPATHREPVAMVTSLDDLRKVPLYLVRSAKDLPADAPDGAIAFQV